MEQTSRGDVYDFQEDNAYNTDEDSLLEEKYVKLKGVLGFKWWSLVRSADGEIDIILDGQDLAAFLQCHPKSSSFTFGNVVSACKTNHKFVQFTGTAGKKIFFSLYDFQPFTSSLSRLLPSDINTDSFCRILNDELNKKVLDEFVVNIDETTTDNDSQATLNQYFDEHDKTEEPKTTEKETQGTIHLDEIDEPKIDEPKIDEPKIDGNEQVDNAVLQECASKCIGQERISVHKLKLASNYNAVRPINDVHINNLLHQVEANYLNKKVVEFQPAVGFRNDKEDDVEIIDGNHTSSVMKILNEKYPEEEKFKFRDVILYEHLTRSEMFTLGLIHNEANLSKETTPIEKIRIMRNLLLERFEGQYSQLYQQHIYCVFNAVCKEDKKLERKKRNNLNHLVRLSTMDKDCWDLVEAIHKKNPSQSILFYSKLSSVGVNAGKSVLNKILKGEKLTAINKLIAEEPPAKEGEKLVLQRIREKKKPTIAKGASGQTQQTPHETDPTSQMLEREKSKLTKEREEYSEKIKLLEMEKTNYLKENREFYKKLQMLEMEKSNVEKITEEYLTKIQILEKKNTDLQKKYEECYQTNQILEKKNTHLQKKYEECYQTNQMLEREKSNLQKENEEFDKTYENDLNNEKNEKEKTNKDHEENTLGTEENELVTKRQRTVKDYSEMLKFEKNSRGREKIQTSLQKTLEVKNDEKRKRGDCQSKNQKNRTSEIKKRKLEEKATNEDDDLPFSVGAIDKPASEDLKVNWQKGNIVEALWRADMHWYDAVILEIRTNEYYVEFLMDKVKCLVKDNELRRKKNF